MENVKGVVSLKVVSLINVMRMDALIAKLGTILIKVTVNHVLVRSLDVLSVAHLICALNVLVIS